ncbi:MAG: TolC family protein [Gemmatimonadales bacterium]|nr:TolC family protein [Gemmatimonadota bacterium]MCL4213128.1 TolC family protein [Gemmatimonadales bacterium]
MKSLVLSLCVLAVPAALAAQESARPIPLDEAVRLARRNAPAAIQARNSIKQSSASVRTNYASFLPTLSASSGASRSEGQNVGPSGSLVPIVRPWSGSHGISSSLELFDAGRRYFNLRAAQANLDAAEAAEVTSSFTVALNVKQQYFAVLAARESESAARKQLEQAEQQLRAAVTRVAAGAATRSDSLRSSIQVGNAQLAILQAQNNLATANASLSRLVGSTEFVTALAADTSMTGDIALADAELFRLAEEGPVIRQSQATVTAARQSSRSSKTSYLPTISMRFGANYNSSADAFQLWGDQKNYQYSTSFSVSIPIFNGLGREENVTRAKIAEENAQANLRDARLNARQQMVQQLGAFRTAEARVQIQLASVAAGEEDLRVQQERYNLGASTLLDLLTSQTTLDQARQALIQARLDARTAKAQIEALIGRDL